MLIFAVLAIATVLMSASPGWAHGVLPEDILAIERGGTLAYVWLGAKHMLTGYDHQLFILGVVFFLTRFVDILKFITAFTVGHSITLLVGTLVGWQVNYYVIDAFIALTVCYKGLENIQGFKRFAGFSPPQLLPAVFIFGLIHGLGLSTRLQLLPLPEDGLVVRILAFNLGVEIGQVGALTIMLIGLQVLRGRKEFFGVFSHLGNRVLIAAGLLLFIFQLHGYVHQNFIDELGFSADLHQHAHEELEVKRLRAEHVDSID